MKKSESLQQRARRKLRQLERSRRDGRFLRAMGKLVGAGLLESSSPDVKPYDKSVLLADALWAGQVEPRILELLPAIVVKRPRLFVLPAVLPDDLNAVVRSIRNGRDHPSFRGVEPDSYLSWVERIGTRGKVPTTLRSFRLRPDDLARLHHLKRTLPASSETEVLRIALRHLAASV